ncbi:hypothetical protein [Niabella soli]|nr:hypothetical protein [Niabella soli]
MKKLFCVASLLSCMLLAGLPSRAQDDSITVRNGNEINPYQEKGFKKERLFTGGGVTASFYSGGTVLGVSPVLGYTFNRYFDGGIVLNYVYTGTRDVYEYNDKLRQHVYGPGVFARAFPIDFLFVQAQFEENFTSVRYTPATNNNVNPGKYNANAPSLLLGGGYSTGRANGSSTFFYVSIMADVLKNRNSPYVDVTYGPNGEERIRILPIVRAGINVGLFQNRYGRY